MINTIIRQIETINSSYCPKLVPLFYLVSPQYGAYYLRVGYPNNSSGIHAWIPGRSIQKGVEQSVHEAIERIEKIRSDRAEFNRLLSVV